MDVPQGPVPYYRTGGFGDRPRRGRIRWLVLGIAIALVVGALLVLVLALAPAAFGLAPTAVPYRFGVFFFLFLLVLVFFVVRVLFWTSRYARRGGGRYGANRPVMVARMRYARGEITKEQYDQIVRDLGRGPGSP